VNLRAAIKKRDPKAIRAALAAGDTVGDEELGEALNQPDSVLALLLELDAVPLDDKDDNPLHSIGYAIRDAYPNALRVKRSKDPSIPEPAAVVALKAKADLLVAAGAKLDFEAAVRLGRLADAEKMLAKNPKLAKQRIGDGSASDMAAWSGAWELSDLIQRVAKSGAVFDTAKAEKTLLAWATKQLAAYAKKHREPVRRVAFDFDPQGTLDLNADTGKAIRPGDYSSSQLAEIDGAFLDELCALGARALPLLANVARALEAAKTPGLVRTKDFQVLVFDHDDEEPQAAARRKQRPTGS
jgi:hypothetical protein